MMGLSGGLKSFQIGLAIFIQYRSVTDTHPARHVAVAITLNAKASSLKTSDKLVPVLDRQVLDAAQSTSCAKKMCDKIYFLLKKATGYNL